jgi:heat shock protein HslJ
VERIGKVIPALLVFAVGFGACHRASESSVESRLAGRAFDIHSLTIASRAVPIVPGATTRIEFQPAHGLRLFTGCNQLSGSYAVKGNRLVISRALLTQIGCDALLRKQQQTLVGLVEGHPAIRLDGGRLTLTSRTTAIEASA